MASYPAFDGAGYTPNNLIYFIRMNVMYNKERNG